MTAVAVTGWTVQYATSGSTTWQRTVLSGAIAPGRYFLVQEGSTSSSGDPLPTPDASGSINMSSTSGKIALVHDGNVLTCGASPGSCSSVPSVEDLVGYGDPRANELGTIYQSLNFHYLGQEYGVASAFLDPETGNPLHPIANRQDAGNGRDRASCAE